jgi:5-methylthioadenosine/S-adenosylhomocysteine deaminase
MSSARAAFLITLLTAATSLFAAQRRPVDLVLTGGTVVTVNERREVLAPGAVAIRGSDIIAVGTPEEIRRGYRAARVLDTAGRIVMPGLVNTHTHAPMVMYRGLADDLALMEWLQKYIFPAEAKTVAPAFVRVGTRLAALEMIRSGTTTYADMYYFEDEIARATKEAGIRGVLGQTIIGFPAPDAKSPDEALNRTRRFITAWKGDPLITPAVAPHSMYLLDEAQLLACRDLAVEHGVPLLLHLAETEEEVRTARERHQVSPTAFLERISFWAPVTVAAHAVWMTDDDLAIVSRRGVGISHNPESNMKLASGTAPVTRYLAANVALGLGTDGAASNNDLDMFEAMRQAALLHKLATGDPRAVPAAAALEMATRGGARVLGMERHVGSLEAGKRADLIVVNVQAARHTPMYDPVSHLVYVTRGDDVETVIVHGRTIMRNRRVLTLDEAAVLADARRLAGEVRAAVGASH